MEIPTADIKKWRIYLEPVNKGGKLDQGALYRWYRRKGFDNEFKFPKESHEYGGMQRWPKEPADNSQIVATLLSNDPNNRELAS